MSESQDKKTGKLPGTYKKFIEKFPELGAAWSWAWKQIERGV